MMTNFRKLGLFLAGASLGLLSACHAATSNSTDGDVSADVASMASDLDANTTTSVQTGFVDESSSALDTSSSTSGTSGSARAAASGFSVTVTVTHSVTSGTSFAAGDVVQVVRSWTNANGESVSDTIYRPHIPSSSDFTSTTWAPNAGTTGWSTSGIAATYDSSALTWTLTGNETRTVNGITTANVTVTWVFANSSGLVHLVTLSRQGEQVGGILSSVKLNTTIYYAVNSGKTVEVLRVVDELNGSSKLGRMVYAWGLVPTADLTGNNVPPLYDSTASGAASPGLSFTPAIAVDSSSNTNAGSVDVWYWSDPSVSLPTTVKWEDLTTYPKLDVSRWLGVVHQEYGPRKADWYRPSPTSNTFTGAYVRRTTLTLYSSAGSNTTQVYSASDGTTVLKTLGESTYRTAANGTVTVTRTWSDGKTSTATITPTLSSTGQLQSVTVTRGSTTYTATVTHDSNGTPTQISVSNGSKTTTYTQASDGSWTAS